MPNRSTQGKVHRPSRSRLAPAVVAVGGGSGLSVVLRGLKELSIPDLSAVVTMSDDGGSSGRLRREYGVLPPGDIRNCLSALAGDEDLLARLFQYRFPDGGDLAGHSFGNLFLTALTGITGDFYQAVLHDPKKLAAAALSVGLRLAHRPTTRSPRSHPFSRAAGGSDTMLVAPARASARGKKSGKKQE